MKLSYFMMPLHGLEKDYHQQLLEDIEAIIYADELGYAEAWVGEHYSSGAEPVTSPLMFLANLIPRTKQIKFATGVICMPQYHPAAIAGQAAMFDHLCDGRFILGVGPGGLPPDFELFGTMDADRNEMFAESIDTVLRYWTTDPPYNFEGKYWKSKIEKWTVPEMKLGYLTKPLQRPHPPIAVSALSPYSSSIKLAGQRGWQPVSANFIGAWSVKTHWEVYEAAAKEHGHEVDREMWRVARSIHVGESDQEAEDFVKTPNGAFDFYYRYLFAIFDRAQMRGAFVINPEDNPNDLTGEALRDNFVIHGNVRTVTEKILALREEIGHFGNLLMTAHDWVDKDKMKASMTRMAREVMPAVNDAISGESEPK